MWTKNKYLHIYSYYFQCSCLNVLKLLWTIAKLGRSLSVMCLPLACYNVDSESCKARSPCYKVSNQLGHVETKMERCFRPSNHIRCLLPVNGYANAYLASLRISCSLRSTRLLGPSRREVDVLVKKYGVKKGRKHIWNMTFRSSGT